MTAKADSLTVEQAEQALQDAKHAREELRERLIAGADDVTDTDVAEADDHVVFAELRLEAAHAADERRREHARRTRIGQIRSSLTDGHLADQAAELVDLARQARTILDELYEAADRHNDEVRAAFLELASLGPLPDDVQISAGLGGGPPSSVLVDGTRVHLTRKLPINLVVDAAFQVLSDHGHKGSDVGSDLRRHTGRVGRPGQSTSTMPVTEHLSFQYRLNGHRED